MNVGLDLGSHALRGIWQQGDHLHARQCRAAYAVAPESESQLRLLDRLGVPFSRCDGGLVLFSEAADECAELLHVSPYRLFAEGQLPRQDPLSRQVLAAYLDHLFPQAKQHEASLCGFTCPVGQQQRDFLSQVIRLKGYQPLPISAGLALILAELVGTAFTGIGVTIGATHCEFSLAFQGIEQASGIVERGGEWIDEEFARRTRAYRWDATGGKLLDMHAAEQTRNRMGNVTTPTSQRESLVLSGLYEELVEALRCEMVRVLSGPASRFAAVPITLVYSGGVTCVEGFEDLLKTQLENDLFPMSIRELRAANSSPYHIARGCLIHAELEARSQASVRAA